MKHDDLQQAIYDRLTGTPAVMALVQGVFDHVDQDQSFPYIVIGEDTATEWDVDERLGMDHAIGIHVWSRFRGRSQVKRIQDAIYAALHRHQFVISGAHVVTTEFEYADTVPEPDGLTRHGIQRFRVLLNEE